MTPPLVRDLFLELGRSPGFQGVARACASGSVRNLELSGLCPAARAVFAVLLFQAAGKPLVVVVDSNKEAEALAETLETFYRLLFSDRQAGPLLLPAPDGLPYDGLPPHPEISEKRANTLWRLASAESRTAPGSAGPPLLIAPFAAALRKTRPPEFYRGLACRINRGEELSLELLVEELVRLGYQRNEPVEMVGQFSVRGGILDAFPPEDARPARLEFFGDQVESIRRFDVESQRSVSPIDELLLRPLVEDPAGTEAGAPASGSLLDMLPGAVLVYDQQEKILEAARTLWQRLEAAAAQHAGAPPPGSYYWTPEEWSSQAAGFHQVRFEELDIEQPGPGRFQVPTRPAPRFQGNMPRCMSELQSQLREGYRAVFFGVSNGEVERLADIFNEYGIGFQLALKDPSSASSRFLQEKAYLAGAFFNVTLLRGAVRRGSVFPESLLAVYGAGDLFEVSEMVGRPQPSRSRLSTFLPDFQDLKSGDLVVHVDHGIGRYNGIRPIEQDGHQEEFMSLEYADNARLYVPLSRLDLVQKYRASEGSHPQLDRLGGATWNRTRTRIKARLRDAAEELLRHYAARKLAPGFAFSPDSNWQREFEDAFEFTETEDQLTSVREIKRDMQQDHPMDRLVCGDVGFGKTEVAMRAAFKALGDGKQVAVLAPTTVLAFQHFETFRQRFAPFPVCVEMLSRFRTPREAKQVLARLAAGQVDILIGTHRLFSADVEFRDLGLLVIDEEQRFGVRHKERLQQIKKGVDVLTLTATPIPRTLHMSLVGLRDLSTIQTPPQDRLSIQTVVAPLSDQIVSAAISQELGRSGQVFFVYNRVDNIWSIAAWIQQLAPGARIGVGHGQMPEKDLEKIMLRFMRHEYDVLVSTTIVENGLDIPLANTIIVCRAERFGLSELYQLRGRVGRSNRRAYAYLLVSPDSELTPVARKRLAALKEFSELGAGFKIAALDLELRGAGNLLGGEQHGHIAAVGFEMYCRMLESAVRELSGQPDTVPGPVTLHLRLDIRIPPDYIADENQRLRAYKRLAAVSSEEERQRVRQEMEDRYGALPEATANLVEYAGLKLLAEQMRIESVERRGDRVSVKFRPEARVDPQKLLELVKATPGSEFHPSGVLKLPSPPGPAAQTLALIGEMLRGLQTAQAAPAPLRLY